MNVILLTCLLPALLISWGQPVERMEEDKLPPSQEIPFQGEAGLLTALFVSRGQPLENLLEEDKLPPSPTPQDVPFQEEAGLLRTTRLDFCFRDSSGNPVPGLDVAWEGELTESGWMNVAGYTDTEGKTILAEDAFYTRQLPLTVGDVVLVTAINRYAPMELYQTYSITVPEDGVPQIDLIWNKEIPKETAVRHPQRLHIRLVDEKGCPVPGVQLSFSEKVPPSSEGKVLPTLLDDKILYSGQGFTRTDGQGEVILVGLPAASLQIHASLRVVPDCMTGGTAEVLRQTFSLETTGQGAETFTLIWDPEIVDS